MDESLPRSVRFIVHILSPDRLPVWMNERNAIETAYTVFPVDEHLVLETCRRKYDWIETLV